MNDVAQQAPARLEQRLIPTESINQDNWYVFDADTLELAYIMGSKYPRPTAKASQSVMRGYAVQRQKPQLWKAVKA